MTDHKNHQPENKNKHEKPDAQLLVPLVDHDPEGRLIYHPAIGRGTIWGGLIGGIIFGLLAWLVAEGAVPICGLGQLGAAGNGPAAFLGFSIGSGIGGLVGAVLGMRQLGYQE